MSAELGGGAEPRGDPPASPADRPEPPAERPERRADLPEPGAERPEPRAPRPMLERLGLALIALVLGVLFGTVAAAAWTGGEIFLAAMGAIGCLMTLWVGGLTLFRG
jgi:hypothetical protein